MKLSDYPFKPFAFYFKGSTLAHTGLFVLALIAGLFFKSELDKVRDYNLKLVQSSVKVDVVAMPEMTVQELKSMQQQMAEPAPPAEETTRVEEEKPEPVEKDSYKVEEKKKSFSDMLKQYSNKVDSKVAKAKKLETKNVPVSNNYDTKELKNLVLAGNKLSKGESLVDGKSVTETTEFERYASALPDLVRTNWNIPSYLAEQELKCRIRIFVNKSGRLIKAQIYESSGNQEYDMRALDAVKKTSYPIPATTIGNVVRDGTILLGFPL